MNSRIDFLNMPNFKGQAVEMRERGREKETELTALHINKGSMEISILGEWNLGRQRKCFNHGIFFIENGMIVYVKQYSLKKTLLFPKTMKITVCYLQVL